MKETLNWDKIQIVESYDKAFQDLFNLRNLSGETP